MYVLAGNVGACVTNTKPNSSSYSLGLIEHPPKVTKDGTLLLEYRGMVFIYYYYIFFY